MTLKQRIEDVIDDIKNHNQSTQLMYSDISEGGGLDKTVLRASKQSKSQKNHKFMNYVLRERKTQLQSNGRPESSSYVGTEEFQR